MIFSGFEHHHQKLAPVNVFLWRVARNFGFGMVMIGIALIIGCSGYHWIAGFDWVDSFLEASMILGGMAAYYLPMRYFGAGIRLVMLKAAAWLKSATDKFIDR